MEFITPTPELLGRLVESGIALLPAEEITTHFVFERDGFVALVERREDQFGNIGAPGLLVEERGFAALVWKGSEAWFIARGFAERATESQVAALRRFDRDLHQALRPQPNHDAANTSNRA